MGFLGFGTKLCRIRTYGFLRFFVPGQIGRFSTFSSNDFKLHVYHLKQSQLPSWRSNQNKRVPLTFIFHFHSNQPHQPCDAPIELIDPPPPTNRYLPNPHTPRSQLMYDFPCILGQPNSFWWLIFWMHKSMVSYVIIALQHINYSTTHLLINIAIDLSTPLPTDISSLDILLQLNLSKLAAMARRFTVISTVHPF